MLKQVYRKAIRAGGPGMEIRRAERIFGGDAKLKKNVFRACREAHFGQAIEKGVIHDHRVIEQLQKMGAAAVIMLRIEAKLKRKLTRSRVIVFVRTYLQISQERQALQMATSVLRAVANRANSVETVEAV